VISAIVLAAGRATRFGSTKQLATVRGLPLVQHAVDAAIGGGCDEVVVVLGHDADAVRNALDLSGGGRTVVNPDFAEGQSTSLRAGLGALSPESAAAVVLLADQPGVTASEVRAVLDAERATHASLVRARYRDGTSGHPVLIGRELWGEAAAATGDAGARELLERHAAEIQHVNVDRDPPPDVDTPDGLLRASRDVSPPRNPG
jgi:molybdenum cofactor cytidylyltransferase